MKEATSSGVNFYVEMAFMVIGVPKGEIKIAVLWAFGPESGDKSIKDMVEMWATEHPELDSIEKEGRTLKGLEKVAMEYMKVSKTLIHFLNHTHMGAVLKGKKP